MILSIGISNQTQAQNLIIDHISQSVEVKRENLDLVKIFTFDFNRLTDICLLYTSDAADE